MTKMIYPIRDYHVPELSDNRCNTKADTVLIVILQIKKIIKVNIYIYARLPVTSDLV